MFRQNWRSLPTAGVLFLLAGVALAGAAGALPQSALAGAAQFNFKYWDTEHGLPQMTPRAITQTRDGYLWVGTFNGLARFDGVRFVSFTVGNTPELLSDTIEVLHEDAAGTLWIGTGGGGLVRYRAGEFSPVPDETGFRGHTVTAISEAGAGKLWVGTLRGLFQVPGDRLLLVPGLIQVRVEPIVGLCVGAPNELWVATPKAVFCLIEGRGLGRSFAVHKEIHTISCDPSGDLRIAFAPGGLARVRKGSDALEVEPIHWKASAFHLGGSGAFWIGTSKGQLLRPRPDEPKAYESVASMGDRDISGLYEDRRGNLWVGAESAGLWRLRQTRVTVYSTNRGLLVPEVTSLCEDRQGRIWVGTFGKGLHLWEGRDFRPIPIGPGAVNVTGVIERRDGSVWCGTYGSSLFRHTGEDRFEPQPGVGMRSRTLFEDREGGLWIGTLREGVEHWKDGQQSRYTIAEGLSNDHVQSIIQGKKGRLWIGTMHGLNRLGDGIIERFHREHGLGGNNVRCLHLDHHGTLWIGSTTGGLTRFHEGRFRAIDSRHGLINDWIEQIIEDDAGNLWLGSNAGLMRVSLSELNACVDGRVPYVHCVAFRREEGSSIPNSGTGFQPSSVKTRAGELWFGTSGGILVIDPKRIRPDPVPPSVHIEELVVDGERQEVTTDSPALVTVPPNRQRVELRFTGLDFSAPAAVRFKYRLEGYDQDWVNAGTRRDAVYTRLPPGQYRFQVTAANNDGAWNETGAALALMIFPSWWQTWWFRIVAILGLTGIAGAAYKSRITRLRHARQLHESFSRRLIESQEQERKRLAGELHDSLGQALQIIKGRAQLALRPTNPASDPTHQLREISLTASSAIQEVRNISRALRPTELDELGLTKAVEWLVEKASETSGVRFDHELDDLGDQFPPETGIALYRIAQEAVNNILKHAKATEVIVELKRLPYHVRLSILDNGRGFAAPAAPRSTIHGPGLGLASMAERTRLLHGHFDIQSTPGIGTRVTALFPMPAPSYGHQDQSPHRG